MKNVIYGTLSLLILFTLSVHSFCYAHEDPKKASSDSSPLQAISDELWKASLVTFGELLKTDPESARTELQNVSKSLFSEHLLTEEWVPLYFRIRHKGTQHLSDVKRLAELEIRMLTDIAMKTGDFQKIAHPLQQLQEAYQKYDDLEKVQQKHSHGHSRSHPPKTEDSSRGTDGSAEIDESDMEKLRVGYLSRFKEAFNDHPLTEKWVDTTLALAAKKKATYPELIELIELQIQIMREVDPEKHKAVIQKSEAGLKEMKMVRDLLEKQGRLETERVNFNFDLNEQLLRLRGLDK